MARRSRSNNQAASRGTIVTATPSFVRRPPVVLLAPLSDRRYFDFEARIRAAPVSVGMRSASRLRVAPLHSLWSGPLSPGVGFKDPRRVDLCRRRRVRSRVLHARGVAGGRGFRRARRNEWSAVHCT